MKMDQLDKLLPNEGLFRLDQDRSAYCALTVNPSIGPYFQYSVVVPKSWIKQPEQTRRRVDINGEENFVDLGIFSPTVRPWPPIVFSIGFSRAPEGMTVSGLFDGYCQDAGYTVLKQGPQEFALGNGIEGLVSKEHAKTGTILTRLAMVEDGGRVFVLGGMAPASLYLEHVKPLTMAIHSFELLIQRGPTMRIS